MLRQPVTCGSVTQGRIDLFLVYINPFSHVLCVLLIKRSIRFADVIFLNTAAGGCRVNNGGCEQLCVNGYNGHFYCRCRPGYQLEADGKTCLGMCLCYITQPVLSANKHEILDKFLVSSMTCAEFQNLSQ